MNHALNIIIWWSSFRVDVQTDPQHHCYDASQSYVFQSVLHIQLPRSGETRPTKKGMYEVHQAFIARTHRMNVDEDSEQILRTSSPAG